MPECTHAQEGAMPFVPGHACASGRRLKGALEPGRQTDGPGHSVLILSLVRLLISALPSLSTH